MRNKPLVLGIFGASGRLGRSIVALCENNPDFEIGALFTHAESKNLAPPYISDQTPVSVDLYIDVSLPQALPRHLAAARAAKRPIAIGVTGLKEEDLRLIEEAARQIPILYTPNFSLGMALLEELARNTARRFHSDSAIHLVETHHVHKKDAPSGSALRLAQAIEKEGSRPPQIRSLRIGETPGTHEIRFSIAEEELCLTHTVHNRGAFAKGALAAARFLIDQPPGLYHSY